MGIKVSLIKEKDKEDEVKDGQLLKRETPKKIKFASYMSVLFWNNFIPIELNEETQAVIEKSYFYDLIKAKRICVEKTKIIE